MARYVGRAAALGRSIGVAVAVEEFADRTGAPQRESAALLDSAQSALLVALDERGDLWSSKTLAGRLAAWHESGAGGGTVCFALGGADGHHKALREAAAHTLSLSALTLPHLLARVLLAEQLYRALTIRVGHPYHRA